MTLRGFAQFTEWTPSDDIKPAVLAVTDSPAVAFGADLLGLTVDKVDHNGKGSRYVAGKVQAVGMHDVGFSEGTHELCRRYIMTHFSPEPVMFVGVMGYIKGGDIGYVMKNGKIAEAMIAFECRSAVTARRLVGPGGAAFVLQRLLEIHFGINASHDGKLSSPDYKASANVVIMTWTRNTP